MKQPIKEGSIDRPFHPSSGRGAYERIFPDLNFQVLFDSWSSNVGVNSLTRLPETPNILLMEEILYRLSHYLQGVYISGGAGFLPSTVVPLHHPQASSKNSS